jgi:hypothetical protein
VWTLKKENALRFSRRKTKRGHRRENPKMSDDISGLKKTIDAPRRLPSMARVAAI